jgi:hypothetical protein
MAKYTYKGQGIIWDADENKPLATFGKDKTFVTEDGKVAGKLKKLGYEPIEVIKDKKDDDKNGQDNGGQGNADNS